MVRYFTSFLFIVFPFFLFAQAGQIKGIVKSNGKPLAFVNIGISGLSKGTTTDENGIFKIEDVVAGHHTLVFSFVGFLTKKETVHLVANQVKDLAVEMKENVSSIDEIVITGTLKEMSYAESAVRVEILSPQLFRKNPTPSVFEALQMINGVQPQVNCNVCNTGDIHINGMEGPYTMVTIDGMPIVSALSTVYGLNGIPNSMVDRIEVVKGPSSTLFGSEAVGGVINIITKNPVKAPLFAFESYGTNQLETNTDLSFKANLKRTTTLLGINYFKFKNRIDLNNDNFTDIALQDRISIFNKYNFSRKGGREAQVALRYVYEDRMGGQMQYEKQHRGSDQVYGESIYTSRYELIGKYELPLAEKVVFNYSLNSHNQNSVYGENFFIAQQNIAFGQFLWYKSMRNHDLLTGLPLRYTFYDDSTPGTAGLNGENTPEKTFLPGVFVQDEWRLSAKTTLLSGVRYDYHSKHGGIFSPRFSMKLSPNSHNTFRLSAGNGYRVVNLFTEDHAALTGSRQVVIANKLKPEQSYNISASMLSHINVKNGFISLDGNFFYTYFTNKIVGDFDTDPNLIIYDNLNGYSISKGIALNTDISFENGLKILTGITLMDVSLTELNDNGINETKPQLLAPALSGTFTISYAFQQYGITLDYTGKFTGPMHLADIPGVPAKSPFYSIQNIQVTKKIKTKWEIFSGVKNLLNFMPKYPIISPETPFSENFDTTYNYAPVQGIRMFLGFRYTVGGK